jgi:hypothetical protein
MTVEVPAARPELVFASAQPDRAMEAIAPGGTVRQFEPYMDSRPAMLERAARGRSPTVQVYSTRFQLLAVSQITDTVRVVSAQYLLLYLLYQAHIATGAARELFVAYYKHTLGLLRAADTLLAKMQKESSPEVFGRVANTTPFVLTTRVMGDENYGAAYRINLARDVQRSGLALPANSPLAGHLPSLDNLPTNYYPDNPRYAKEARPTFDYNANPLFRRAGQETSKIGAH